MATEQDWQREKETLPCPGWAAAGDVGSKALGSLGIPQEESQKDN
jgi:hypothetical protein